MAVGLFLELMLMMLMERFNRNRVLMSQEYLHLWELFWSISFGIRVILVVIALAYRFNSYIFELVVAGFVLWN